MSLNPSHFIAVHDLEYLKNMSRLIEKELSKHRCAPRGRVMERECKDPEVSGTKVIGQSRLGRASQEDGKGPGPHGAREGLGWMAREAWRKQEKRLGRHGAGKTHKMRDSHS